VIRKHGLMEASYTSITASRGPRKQEGKEMRCRGFDPSILTLPLVLGYCGLLLMLSTFIKPQFDTNLPVDKIGHFIVFGGLGVSVGRYFSKEFGSSAALGLALTVLACAFFGLCDEMYQLFIPGKGTEARDVLADCVGAGAGGLVYLILLRKVCSDTRERTLSLKRFWPLRGQNMIPPRSAGRWTLPGVPKN